MSGRGGELGRVGVKGVDLIGSGSGNSATHEHKDFSADPIFVVGAERSVCLVVDRRERPAC